MTDHAELERAIEAAWEARDTITPDTGGAARAAIETTLEALDKGAVRVAERRDDGVWHVNQWAKKAVLLGFRLQDMAPQSGGPQGGGWWDKVDSKFKGWTDHDWRAAGFRAVPTAVVRRSAYIAPGVILMPSFVNLGAYVGEGTMVDTWATVGSCAQIGKNVHLSGGVGIGGVLEPMQAGPTIIEDDCFIGARSEVVEGCIVREGSVLGMGVFLGQSTKIVDRATGEVSYGEVPPYSVVVAGSPARQAPARRLPRPEPLLRRHRQARRRPHPLEDRDQRTATRLTAPNAVRLNRWHGRPDPGETAPRGDRDGPPALPAPVPARPRPRRPLGARPGDDHRRRRAVGGRDRRRALPAPDRQHRLRPRDHPEPRARHRHRLGARRDHRRADRRRAGPQPRLPRHRRLARR